ncbi:hypothetical protein IT400_00660 [Candidatus Nomurabacteria bacterium]|nr:hypothetical protein [Candidatus Nomurabacteria bacterium]
MNSSKQKSIYAILLILFLFIVGFLLFGINYRNNIENNFVDKYANLDEEDPIFNCGLSIKSPIEGENITISTGIDIVATLDNTNREAIGCSWTAFEAQIGVVYVKDMDGNDITKPTPLTTTEEWMIEKAVNYSTHLNILNNYTGPATIVIDEENPSGEKPSKTISIPINITE